MNSKIKKISIGTAQFGLNYGSLRKRKKITNFDFKKIISYCKKKRISKLDTAINYGDSQKKIGKILKRSKNKFTITSKIPTLKNVKIKNINKIILNFIKSSRKDLQNEIDTILIHDENDLLLKKGKVIFETLSKLKKRKIVKNIGFSIYSFENILKIIKKYQFDTIQVPFNLFDQRILNPKILKTLKRKRIKIQIRSIFLQGLLVEYNKKNLIKKSFRLKFKNLDEFLSKNKINALEACIMFVKNYNFYSNIIIGVDNFDQLKEILMYFNKNKNCNINFNNLKSNDLQLINPLYWKK